MSDFKPQHMNATMDDLLGNGDKGRYLFLTGSDERAQQISDRFTDPVVKRHPRQHNFYLGTLPGQNGIIDVGAISTGMGGPSADIIINELAALGARRLLRIGTAASLQSERVNVGDLVIATGAVRDDKSSWDYIYREYPAVASLEFLVASGRAIKKMTLPINTHFGLVHSKSSLFAREFNLSLTEENRHYMEGIRQAGVLATEMECAQLFTLSSLLSARQQQLHPQSQAQNILAGAILAIIGDDRVSFSDNKEATSRAVTAAIELGLETIMEMQAIDENPHSLF
ncbi:uridine phosphorylase [Legionella taurinensis]|uniref:Uridine phosphorylase n=1 Tax=Legionella taurinensis TaxID=70611 RepID=A0AB38N3F5_9GAMM|nr:nucleoside phosphorylase [Legionella taurinensis]MDX1838703.1 nucleoside phosphorylase [Legionella taurinensis]PUT38794.1 uridine phosphorylase [Legionella taurinensis]PUT40208.1 uridine phosphorylase [Legionella taurinensis]PUT42514.1 uridine phosphorylase [Legionella taurinensis]PUT45934.1 uridine phosphorylase [Legionella taurinensis]